MKSYEYILMDLDGTLTDPFTGITKSVQYALNHYGIVVDDLTRLTPFIGPPLVDSFQEFYQFPRKQAQEAVQIYHERFVNEGWLENKIYEGIEDFLISQKKLGRQLFVATSKPEPLAIKILNHFNISCYFSFIGGDTMDHTRSSKGDVLQYIMNQGFISNRDKAVMQQGAMGDKFGHFFVYALYGIICFIAAIFVWKLVPETKGMTLEQMSKMWKPSNKK